MISPRIAGAGADQVDRHARTARRSPRPRARGPRPRPRRPASGGRAAPSASTTERAVRQRSQARSQSCPSPSVTAWAATGTVQPPPSRAAQARSARSTSALPGVADARATSCSSPARPAARRCPARTRAASRSTRCGSRSRAPRSRRSRPQAARMTPSSPRSERLRRRVSTLPRTALDAQVRPQRAQLRRRVASTPCRRGRPRAPRPRTACRAAPRVAGIRARQARAASASPSASRRS